MIFGVNYPFNGTRTGSLATIYCEPRQIRKEATAAVDSGAEVWLLWVPPNFQNNLV